MSGAYGVWSPAAGGWVDGPFHGAAEQALTAVRSVDPDASIEQMCDQEDHADLTADTCPCKDAEEE